MSRITSTALIIATLYTLLGDTALNSVSGLIFSVIGLYSCYTDYKTKI
jgi:hypothetical protein